MKQFNFGVIKLISNNLKRLQPIIDNLKGCTGHISMCINNYNVILNNKSVVGDAIESWIINYLNNYLVFESTLNMKIEKNLVSQTFPDAYIISSEGKTFLEIKSFDVKADANFDLANFESYVDSLSQNIEKIYADYLVIGYSLINGIFKIEGIWYKNIWELCSPSKDWALKLQIKRGMIYNIRPCNNMTKCPKYHPFKKPSEFIDAIQSVLDNYEKTRGKYKNWKCNLDLNKVID